MRIASTGQVTIARTTGRWRASPPGRRSGSRSHRRALPSGAASRSAAARRGRRPWRRAARVGDGQHEHGPMPAMTAATHPMAARFGSSVAIGVAGRDPVRPVGSGAGGSRGGPVIDALIHTEVPVAHARVAEAGAVPPPALFRREAPPWEAASLAGRALLASRRRGGQPRAVIPDFHAGARAALRGRTLLTAAAGRCRTPFPTPEKIAPSPPPRSACRRTTR
jgi:hypothetical protein